MASRKRGALKSGRSHTKIVDDARIGAAVHQLLLWGFPRQGACECLADAARAVRGCIDPGGRALCSERIEQIYQAWLIASGIQPQRCEHLGEGLGGTRPCLLQRQDGTRYTTPTLMDLAVGLLDGRELPELMALAEQLREQADADTVFRPA